MTHKKALITGITGFTGHYMAQNLINHGYEVHGLVRNLPATSSHSALLQNITLHTCDFLHHQENLSQILQQVQPDVIIHLAAIANVAHGSSLDFYQHNVLLTENLMKAIQQSQKQSEFKVRAILAASSANVYGNNHSGVALTEDIAIAPANHYAISKAAMEQMLGWYADLPIIITRPFNYTGAGQTNHFLIPKIVEHFKAHKKVIELGNIDVARDFSDVEDVVNDYRLIIEKYMINQVSEKSSSLPIFNVCSGQTHSLRQVIEMMQQIAAYEIEIQINPQFVRANDVKILYGNSQKINSFLENQNQNRIELINTLKKMYEN